jgi:hypothetical protein
MSYSSKYARGDLVSAKSDFPLALRNGPGYTFEYICLMEPNSVGLILDYRLGHGSITWLNILTKTSSGWIPENKACIRFIF